MKLRQYFSILILSTLLITLTQTYHRYLINTTDKQSRCHQQIQKNHDTISLDNAQGTEGKQISCIPCSRKYSKIRKHCIILKYEKMVNNRDKNPHFDVNFFHSATRCFYFNDKRVVKVISKL